MTGYIVMERPIGSKSWTIAARPTGTPSLFYNPAALNEFLESDEMQEKRGANGAPMDWHVVSFVVPE